MNKTNESDQAQADIQLGIARGRELAQEVAQAIGHENSDGSVPEWVLNACKLFARDTLGITTFDTQAEPPGRLGKQMARAQHVLNELRNDPVVTNQDPTARIEDGMGFLEGFILGTIILHLRSDDRRSVQFFEAFAKFKRRVLNPPKGQAERATALTQLGLIIFWKDIEKCRTIAQAFELLKAVGWVTDTEKEGFRSICRRLKLKLGKKGRPPAE